MATFVLVPGAFHGAWWFEPLARRLRADGHDARAAELTGVGERVHLSSGTVNLDTHIQDVVNLLEYAELTDVVLVAHSYGGMVITGAADRLADSGRVRALVYLDAFVPEDGDSVWKLSPQVWRDRYVAGVGADGFSMAPPPFLTEPRVTSQPLATMLQSITLTGASDKIEHRHYIYMSAYEGTPFTRFHDRLSADPSWTVRSLPFGHNVMSECPDEIHALLLDAVTRATR
ncbi:alpha/beta fold hydrolase [Nonomuraea sp. NPDC005501]|uniref:alpha/beta fold hydrolase n=1 Tax=Nonomuraea sp. NPDC005501 TaxID=3156884 RepID=UPI0033A82A72